MHELITNVIDCLRNINWTAVTSILGLIGVFLTYHTLKEMRKARVESYKPTIFIQTKPVYVQPLITEISFYWKDTQDITKKDVNFSKTTCFLDFVNAGLGPALNVEIEFKPDKEKMLLELSKFAEQYPEYIEIKDKQIRLKWDNLNSKKGKCDVSSSTQVYSCFEEDEILKNNRTCIFPHSESNPGLKLELPKSVLLYNSLVIFFKQLENPMADNMITLPDLNVRVSYKDVGKRSLPADEFCIVFEAYLLTTDTSFRPGTELEGKNIAYVIIYTK